MTRYKNNQITNNMTHLSIHFFTLIANIPNTDWHISTYTGLHRYTTLISCIVSNLYYGSSSKH